MTAEPPPLPEPPSPLPPAPQPVAEIDEGLRRALTAARNARRFLIGGVALLLTAAVIILAVLYAGDHSQLRAEQRLAAIQQAQLAAQQAQLAAQAGELKASCRWWAGLSPLPVTIAPGSKQPSRLSVTLIAGARDAYAGQHCGTLPPAAASLTHWAQVFGITAR